MSGGDNIQPKNIFVFDKNKCVGCGACAVACINENGMQAPDQWRNISSSNVSHFPGIPLFYLSLACNHCDDAPCMMNCPALAYSRDEQTGAVIHHPEKCIGCQYCTWACPYNAPKYNPQQGIIEKCTFCNHRLLENAIPACADLCPTAALGFAKEITDRHVLKETSPFAVDVGARLKAIELRNNKGPEIDNTLFKDVRHKREKAKPTKITAVKEWPLVFFTIIISIVVAVLAAGNNAIIKVDKTIVIISLVFASVLSMLHLGKKIRAWRSVLNQKNSWLSREIMAFITFITLSIVDVYLATLPSVVFLLTGFLLLLSVDKLYELAMWKWSVKIHSGQTLLIGVTLWTLLSGWFIAFVALCLLKTGLYVYRMASLKTGLSFWNVVRLVFILMTMIGLYMSLNIAYLLPLFILGELIDRIQFYNELEVPIVENEINQAN